MATAISKALLEAALGECYDAITSDDWDSAKRWYARAEVQLAGLEVQGGAGGAYYRLRNNLDSVAKAIDAAKNSVNKGSGDSGFITTKTNFQGGSDIR